ncbi:hydrogenase nickel insertion protein HypA [Eubacterium sp. 14-2]|uniref:hydrogenase maturation nickel metallochaperone HypA n=1 Tax=Eubacterium sp. 14-2 TaxID=1235790 RepID=UPI00033C0F40|nr:hydrogenase maturation nickel metallochaperone HypA [Eubacterium sp. 14-2]EOT24343.1 hydrogenase nickel insertion protein HypA [Eubacterium sp. 14-2]
MHELGIVFHIVKTVERVAEENQADKITKVTLQIGEVSTVIPYYLKDCWKWKCSKSERMDGCELVIETIPAITYCEACEETYPTVEHGKICPYCGSEHTYLIQGNEHQIKEIEVS